MQLSNKKNHEHLSIIDTYSFIIHPFVLDAYLKMTLQIVLGVMFISKFISKTKNKNTHLQIFEQRSTQFLRLRTQFT